MIKDVPVCGEEENPGVNLSALEGLNQSQRGETLPQTPVWDAGRWFIWERSEPTVTATTSGNHRTLRDRRESLPLAATPRVNFGTT